MYKLGATELVSQNGKSGAVALLLGRSAVVRPARRTAPKSRCRRRGAPPLHAPARRTHPDTATAPTTTLNQVGTKGPGEVDVDGRPALAKISMMSSTGVATRVHPSLLVRESSPLETASFFHSFIRFS